ncbi:MAG: hypothetical protein NTV86_14595 [Planctomycetota bacterium]|nr:hypothetical protein [Planctomycetota bacterium]
MGPSGTTSPHRPGFRAVPEWVSAALLGVAALAAGATLLFQIGQVDRTAAFHRPEGWSGVILWVQAGVLALFVADRLLGLLAAPDKAAHLGANGFDLALCTC